MFSLRRNITRVLFLLFLLAASYGYAAAELIPTIHSTSNGGDWSNTSTWEEGRLPTADDIVEIKGRVGVPATTVNGLVITASGSIYNVGTNGYFTVTGDAINDGDIDLHRYTSSYGVTTHYTINLKVFGDIENNGSIGDTKVYTQSSLTNNGVFASTASLYTYGTGAISVEGTIDGKINHSSDGSLTLGGYVNNLNITKNTELHGILDIGTLSLNTYELDLYNTTTNTIATLNGSGKLHDSRGNISELTITNIETSSGAELLFSKITTQGINGWFTGAGEVYMNGGTISGGNITVDTLTLDVLIKTAGFYLHGDLDITASGALRNVEANGTFLVEGNLVNDGSIDLHTYRRDYSGYYGWYTTHFYINLKVTEHLENSGTITDSKTVYIQKSLSNSGTFSTPLQTIGTGAIDISGDIAGSVTHSSEGNLTLGGYVNTLTLGRSTELQGTLDIGNLYLNSYELDINNTATNTIGTLNDGGKLYDSRGKITELTIGSISTSNAELPFERITTQGIAGSFVGVDEIYMNGGSITTGSINVEHLIIDALVKTGGSTLNGDLEITASGALRNVIANGNFTVNGDILSKGSINLYTYTNDYNPYTGASRTYYYIDLYINGNIENNGSISNTKSYIRWSAIDGYSDYTLEMTGQDDIQVTGTKYLLNTTILNDESNIQWRVKGVGTPDSDWSAYRCINVPGCVKLGETAPIPFNLQQIFKSPYLEEEPIDFGEQIGKYQSGTGIIFRADIENPENKEYKLLIRYDRNGIIETYTGGTVSTGSTLQTILPYSGTGSYTWRAAVSNPDETLISNWIDFENNETLADFILFEGFEPYPFGYSFGNSYAFTGYLDGEIKYTALNPTYGTFKREKIDGTKWKIFDSAFDFSGVSEGEKLTAFEALGLNEAITNKLHGGTCYGMVISAAMEKSGKDYLEKHYSSLDNEIGTGYIYDAVNEPYKINGRWGDNPNIEGDEDVLNSILAIHLSQYGDFSSYSGSGVVIGNPTKILEDIKKYPSNTYVLGFTGVKNNRFAGHIGIPYRVDENNRIYIWDPNIPYVNNIDKDSYTQYIQINLEDNSWESPLYESDGWSEFNDISIVSIDNIYNGGNKPPLPGYNESDILYSLSGKGDILIYDGYGNKSGFQDGLTINEIEGVNIITPYNSILGEDPIENTWKQIYLPEKRDDLTIHINGKTDEDYTLMIAGGDYYTKIEGVSTSSGQTDTFTSTRTGLEIDFDDTKIGDYNLLTDNFYNSGTGTVYLDSIASTSLAQQYNFDWTKVRANDADAVTYTIDEDNNGLFDETPLSLPAIYQDLVAPTTNIELDGLEIPSSTGSSYYDTLDITLSASDNANGTGVKEIYYAMGTGTGELIYIPYSETLTINGVGDFTLNYYAVDNFGNIEENKILNFTLIERPETYAGNISGYVYDDANENGVIDEGEKYMAGWKICIDVNDNGDCEENSEPFITTNNDGYYEFDSLETGTYKVLEIPHQNWRVTSPIEGYYNINLLNAQVIIHKDFGNFKYKGNNKK